MFLSNFTLCGCKNMKYFKSFSTQAETNRKIISDVFGMTKEEAKLYIHNTNLQHKDGELLLQNINFCKKIGYSTDEMIYFPNLLMTNPIELEQHYYTLKEGGFHKVQSHTLAKARTFMNRAVYYLKTVKLIPVNINVAEEFISHIEDKTIAEKIPVCNVDEEQWKHIHLQILKEFLRLKLGSTKEEIADLFEVHRMIKNKSFQVVQRNIKIAEDIGFNSKKIIKNGYLLSNYPSYPETTLRDLEGLAGINMKRAMRSYPKLITASPKNIIRIYGTLKEFDIPDEFIQAQPNVFHLSPETVKLRLQEVEQSSDLKVLLNHPKVLSLIIHHNKAKLRYSLLQQMQLKCTSLFVLKTYYDDQFEEYIKEGKDTNKEWDVIKYLQNLFSISFKEIKKSISRHPFYLQIPLKDMEETYKYLIATNFSSSNILKVIYILLYPRNKVRNAYISLYYDPRTQFKKLDQIKKLNLIMYIMEKDHHFTGNGVWRQDRMYKSRAKLD